MVVELESTRLYLSLIDITHLLTTQHVSHQSLGLDQFIFTCSFGFGLSLRFAIPIHATGAGYSAITMFENAVMYLYFTHRLVFLLRNIPHFNCYCI